MRPNVWRNNDNDDGMIYAVLFLASLTLLKLKFLTEFYVIVTERPTDGHTLLQRCMNASK